MSRDTPQLHLASLDDCPPAALDPAIWSRNLAALVAEEPELAELLRDTALPPTWRPVQALDGYRTWRTEQAGQPAAWLGGTAAPATRAASLLTDYDPAGRNPALASLGAGAELSYLLERLPAHAAVFVFESDVQVLAAVLRSQDLSAAIACGRCVLLPPGKEQDGLLRQLQAHGGLLPPGDILLPSLATPARVAELRRACEHVVAAVSARRAARIQAICATPAAAPAATGRWHTPPRLALLSLQPHPPTHALVQSVERAARALGWEVAVRVYADARSAHPLVHCEALADFGPDIVLFVNHPRGQLPLPRIGHVCVWFLNESAAAAGPDDDGALALAASPRVAAALRRAGWPPAATRSWPWACVPDRAVPAAETDAAAIALVGDLPDAAPEAHGLTSSTHRRLWDALRAAAARGIDESSLNAAVLLEGAERDSGVVLEDPTLRTAFLELTEHVVAPMVTLEGIAAVLARVADRVWTIGQGWQRCRSTWLQPLAADAHEFMAAGLACRPRACVLAGPQDPLGAALLHAAALEWPLLLHDPGRRGLRTELSEVLCAQEHYQTFATLGELRRVVEALGRSPDGARRRAKRAREHVCQAHTYQRRLEDLLAYLSNEAPPVSADP